MKISSLFCLFIISLQCFSAAAEIRLEDDAGHSFKFDKPVQRIISLAPHITELLFAAGASDQVIATVTYSDYPEQAKHIPVIGDHSKYDLEAIIKLKPELIIAWKSGSPADQLQQLKNLGFNIFIHDAFVMEDVAKSLEQMGILMGTESVANKQAIKFLKKLKQLEINYKNKQQVSVFYQVWDAPLMTINKQHIISRIIDLCGGKNIFKDLPVLVPRVGIEAVIAENPDVIITGMAAGRENWLQQWQQWTYLTAVKKNHLFAIHADLITRHTPRILLGAEKMCTFLDQVRP